MSDELILRLRALAARPDDVSEVGYLWKLYAASCEAGDLMSAEVERLRAEIDAMRLDKNNVISTWRGRAGRAEIEKDKLSIERAKLMAENERLRAALRAVACDCVLDSESRRSCVAENSGAGECPHLTARNALKEDGR